jgi:hypothetical protein
MSYSSQNTLAKGTRVQDVREFVGLLGYKKAGILSDEEHGRFEEYGYYDEADYHSWSGIQLAIHRNAQDEIVVMTRSRIGRSYYDLIHQNYTISTLRKRFGGHFLTDEGRGRYLRPTSGPPPPPASGCYLAFNRFGTNLMLAQGYLEAREFPKFQLPPIKLKGMEFLHIFDPRILANNTLMPFLVAATEEYFKSTFIVLLRYSPRKEVFLKGIRLQGDHLISISDGRASVEEAVVEVLPFQRISAICRHFEALDPKIDIGGALRKPYRRRKQSLFDTLEELVITRHDLIHRATLDLTLSDQRLEALIYDLDAAITRVYRRITTYYNWFFGRDWNLSRRSQTNPAQKIDA